MADYGRTASLVLQVDTASAGADGRTASLVLQPATQVNTPDARTSAMLLQPATASVNSTSRTSSLVLQVLTIAPLYALNGEGSFMQGPLVSAGLGVQGAQSQFSDGAVSAELLGDS